MFNGGLRHYVSDNIAVFGEYNYYDYQQDDLGTVRGILNPGSASAAALGDTIKQTYDDNASIFKFGVLASSF